ncbi:MAG: tetratricopeptide repeat protein, partial [Hyalangium sp.]|uniref:tetratricopeptide repeat protein n=1 Tax=Hyalangium sp. TaxID=2028555 RepID=UPI00389AA4D7
GLGQYDTAMQEYDEAEKLDPNLAAIYLNRAIILHRAKDAPERALELYKKYIGMNGGEVAMNAESPVFGLMKEAEAVVQAKAEAKQAEEQAKQMEALQKKQQDELKKNEGGQKPPPGAAAPAGNGAAAPPEDPTAALPPPTPDKAAAPAQQKGAPAAPAQQTVPAPQKAPAGQKAAPGQKNPGKADPTEPSDEF